MEKKKEYAVSYYGGHVTAWVCVAAAVLGVLFFVGFVCISTAVMLLLQERTHLVNEV